MIDNLTYWETPPYYAGFDPVGDIIIATQHRDSSLLDQSNFDVAKARLEKALGDANDVPDNDPDSEAPCYTFSTSHWAVGWVEYLMLCKDAPQASIDEARKIASELSCYPILDEMEYSEREHEAAHDTWLHASLRERIDYCKADRCSIFAARRDYIPDSGTGEIVSILSGERG